MCKYYPTCIVFLQVIYAPQFLSEMFGKTSACIMQRNMVLNDTFGSAIEQLR
jgi:hypothetical protein